jgi:hypothetical protein
MIVIFVNQRIKIFFTAFVTFLLLHQGLHGINYKDRTFYSVNEIHGVSLRTANSVIEDDKGFIWVSGLLASQ